MEKYMLLLIKEKVRLEKRNHKKGKLHLFCLIDQKMLSNLVIRGPHSIRDERPVLCSPLQLTLNRS